MAGRISPSGKSGPARRHRVGDREHLAVVGKVERVVIAEPPLVQRLAVHPARLVDRVRGVLDVDRLGL